MMDVREECYRLIHKVGDVEHVWLVTARNSMDARRSFRDNNDCRLHECSVSAQPFRPDAYLLYAINTATGAMSPSDVTNEKSMCFVCLGNATS